MIRDADDFTVPDSAEAGRPFTVTVLTLGGGCAQKADTEVRIDGSTAVITPYDHVSDGDCATYSVYNEHNANVVFGAVGDGRVILRAVDVNRDPVEVTRLVRVF